MLELVQEEQNFKTDIQDPSYKRHASMGWNYRMPELCSAVALGQVERIKNWYNVE